MDRAGWPFVALGLVPAVVAAWLGWWWLVGVGVAIAAFLAFFYRDPQRVIPDDPMAIVAPADGRVMVAGAVELNVAPPGDWQQISIFLSPLDVHMNRTPVAGRVTRVEYARGAFLAAFKPESAIKNERNDVWIDHAGRTVVVRQLVGVIARRLVCRVREGAHVAAGEKYGLMKFGSRIDLFLPPDVILAVTVGETVRGGETVVARWP